MHILFNGTSIETEIRPLTEVLVGNGIDPLRQGIAVAVNDAVVPRRNWDSTVVNDGDVIEVITAMQGG